MVVNEKHNALLCDGVSIQECIFGTDGSAHVLCVREVAEVTLRAGLGKPIPFVRAEERGTWEDYDVRKWGDDLDGYRKMREGYIIRRVEDL